MSIGSATHEKLAASFVLPVPLYFATWPTGHSGRVLSACPLVRCEATIRAGRGKMRLEPEVSIFNALNVSTVLAVRSLNFGTASYQQPSSILQGRFVRLGIALKW